MSGIKKDPLLAKILEYAATFSGSDKLVVTIESFLLAIIDIANGQTDIDISTADSMRLFIPLRLRLASIDGRTLPKTRAMLAAYVAERAASDDLKADVVKFQDRLNFARREAAQFSLDKITAYDLLSCILDSPGDYLRDYFKKAVRADAIKAAEEYDKETRWYMAEDGDDSDMEEKPEEKPKKKPKQTKQAKENAEEPSVPKEAAVSEEPTDYEPIPETDPPEQGDDMKERVALLTENLKRVRDDLLNVVSGQNHAVNVLVSGCFRGELMAMTDKHRTRPRSTFLFAGPPGVGKTYLAETVAKEFGLPFQRFDMSGYADHETSVHDFKGTNYSYKNSGPGDVTSFVDKYPRCVLLFDEIEKANISVIHLFLQILDAGRLRDDYFAREVSFADAIIIFTTNAGKRLYEDAESYDLSGLSRKVILNELQSEVNPATGKPCFPAAICSRFASGNVVMFNHLSAPHLCEVAEREFMRRAKSFEDEVHIKVNVEKDVFAALMLAEGGAADARMIKNRAGAFYDGELFELCRMLGVNDGVKGLKELKSIEIGVDLPKKNKKIYGLFKDESEPEVLIFAPEQTFARCAAGEPRARLINAQSAAEAQRIVGERNISFVCIDFDQEGKKSSGILNIEDVESEARDFFWFLRENRPGIPVYILQKPDNAMNSEEKISYSGQGVRGTITLSDDTAAFDAEVARVCVALHQQESINRLARENKIVTFETSQRVINKGKTAKIQLFDFSMDVAVDAGDSKRVLSNVSKPNVRFDMVVGAEDAKKELRYFVDYLKNPRKYAAYGVGTPKGILLYGPPGTGKTMLAKAMAAESDATYIAVDGNSFLKKYVGEGPEKVHELFRTARKYAPAIVFVDEIDAIARERGSEDTTAGIDATLIAFLTEMDGFRNDPGKPVFVLAATNFDDGSKGAKRLDPALMRRFDRRLYIGLPDRKERIDYIRQQLKDRPMFRLSDEVIGNLAARSTGMSPAELENVIELALRTAVREGGKVTDAILDEAFETFNGGEKKQWSLSTLERVARHEAGHAFLCWQSGETPSYVTVVARSDRGGYMQHDDREDKPIYTRDELLALIRTSLGGRAAEIVYYGENDGLSTGVSGDLASATSLAQQLVCRYGMDEKFGLAVISDSEAANGEISVEVRKAVNAILAAEMKNAVDSIRANVGSIDALVEKLLSDNHLTGEQIKQILEAK